MARPTIKIDGHSFSTLEEFYDEVSRKLIPGASWGRNLDAFSDILSGGFGTPDGGFVLLWQASEVSRDRLGHGEAARELERRLERCHPSNRRQVEIELAAARSARGPTAFDWLVEIIRSHDTIELTLR
jgi:RNAse (barnase) inhibitor barstar